MTVQESAEFHRLSRNEQREAIENLAFRLSGKNPFRTDDKSRLRSMQARLDYMRKIAK